MFYMYTKLNDDIGLKFLGNILDNVVDRKCGPTSSDEST